VLSLLVILIGAHAYNGIVKDMDGNNQMRASLSYVANKVRAGDESGAVTVDKIDGQDVLIIRANYDGADYKTYIYYSNGSIFEQFNKAEKPFQPGKGDKITAAKAFHMEKSTDNQLKLAATDEKNRQLSLQICLRSGS
jgi:hypothetical protein